MQLKREALPKELGCKDFVTTVINTDKSEVMVFSKPGRLVKNKFRSVIGMDESEYINQYKYLGVIFTSNAKFSAAEKTLSMKANRALFSIKQSIFNKTIKPSSILHIFDALVKPIALYNSDIWLLQHQRQECTIGKNSCLWLEFLPMVHSCLWCCNSGQHINHVLRINRWKKCLNCH